MPTTSLDDLPLDACDLSADEVRARFQRARREGRPAWPWPEVEVGDWRAALRQIEGAARHLLADAPGPARIAAPDARAARALGVAAYTSGMGALLGHWVETGALAADPAAERLLRLHLRHGRLRMERLAAELGRVCDALASAGARAVVLKGMHTSREYFPEPATRPVSDVDLLVEPRALAAAEDALRGAGYRPGRAIRRPYRRDWSPAGREAAGPRSLSLVHADDPWTLDVHVSLDRDFYGAATAHLDRLRSQWPARAVEGASWRVLPPPLLLLLLAVHASEGLHDLMLVRLVELVRVTRRDTEAGALRWGEWVDAAEGAGVLRFAYPALALCEKLAPGSVPAPVRERLAAAAPEGLRRLVEAREPAASQRLDTLSIRERFVWAATPGERLRRAAHALWPAPAGRSITRLGALYGERAWRLLRGGVER
ncbi:MAG TPA: nucleotidyltransferase family protein [Longimicrobiaceae bacterium]|nr:nucleotidyltransferase family protein [Longimicrobiaceae bacterium]